MSHEDLRSELPQSATPTAQPAATRGPGGKFLPGIRTINPGGRPKVLEKERLAFQELTGEARSVLRMIMLDKRRSANDRIRAANSILDRALGKPTQALEHSGPGGKPLERNVDLSFMSVLQIQKLRELAMLTEDDADTLADITETLDTPSPIELADTVSQQPETKDTVSTK